MRSIWLIGALACALFGADGAHAQLAPYKKSYTLTAANPATCGASGCFIPTPAGIGPEGFHVQIVGTATANCQLERELDGATWSIITITAGGTTTQIANWTFSGAAVAEGEDLSEPISGVPYRVNCPSFSSGSLAVIFVQGN